MNLYNEIKANYNKKGYWKQSLVMRFAYANKISLKLSWIIFNRELEKVKEYYYSVNHSMPNNWIKLISQGIEKNKTYLTTKLGD